MSDETPNPPTAVTTGEYVRRKPLHELFKATAGNEQAQSNALLYEDEFKGKYGNLLDGGISIIAPPFLPRQLESLVQHNNALPACIDAMVTNVHETGHGIEAASDTDTDANAEEDPERKRISEFFDEVWPGVPFTSLRKELGTDLEKTGNAYIEVIRNLKGEMLLLRRLDPKLTRLVTLSKFYPADITIRRGETEVKVTVPMRYRRFVQSIGARFVYFKEFGCPLELHKNFGTFDEDGETQQNAPLQKSDKGGRRRAKKAAPNEDQTTEAGRKARRLRLMRANQLASEVIHFKKVDDVETPYGIPAWIPQLPSVLGSRKAEEFNLDYFESGGVPPMMIFVHGGALAKEAKEAIAEFLSSSPGAKQGAPVFEAHGTGGSLDGGASSVRVTVERFGAERQKDSMFETYDKRSEERIRRSWRLPPIFVGMSSDYNFATAQVGYMLAEAQVFKPERDEFDNTINATVMRELDPTRKYRFKSKPIVLKNSENAFKALPLLKEFLEPSEFVRITNEAGGTDAKAREGIDDEQAQRRENEQFFEAEGKSRELWNTDNAPPQIGPDGKPLPSGKPYPIPFDPKARQQAKAGKGKPAPDDQKGIKQKSETQIEVALQLAESVFEAVEQGGNTKKLLGLMADVGGFTLEQKDAFKEALTNRVYEGSVVSDDVTRYTAAALLLSALG